MCEVYKCPIFDWSLDDVWEACGTSAADVDRRRKLYERGEEENSEALKAQALDGWSCHPAYVFGNERLSCALCVLGSKNDLRNGMKHNPDLFQTYLFMEVVGGSTFKNGWSLAELLEDEGRVPHEETDGADFIQLPLLCC